MPDEFEKIIDELITLGEDKEELSFWKSIFSKLAPEYQEQLTTTFKEELENLKKLKI